MSVTTTEFNPVPERMLYGPAAYCARGIENLLIFTKESSGLTHAIGCVAAKAIALTVFPVTLAIGLAVEPFFLARSIVAYYAGYEGADKAWAYSVERLEKLALGIIFSPLAIIAADGVSFLFLERVQVDNKVRPFGVEEVYGRKLDSPIRYPTTVKEVQDAVREAKRDGKTISIIGTNMSQGRQTVPVKSDGIVLNLKNLKDVKMTGDPSVVRAGAGSTWEDVLLVANEHGKSVISKQAGSFFNIAGSFAINCHGWEHDAGAIASTVEELEIIDADGNLRVLTPKDDLFGCMFGTLGYFGVIVGAKIRLKDNEYLQENGVEVSVSDFTDYYERHIKSNSVTPLLMGRLNIDGKPLQKVTVNTFEQIHPKPLVQERFVTPGFKLEPHRGERIARCFLDAVGHLPKMLYDPLVKYYWKRELDIMQEGRVATRNEIMNFEAKSFFQLAQSDLYTQWLQEYFITKENLPEFLEYLGGVLEENDVRLLNASIRPVPKDEISVLPYAEQERYAVVISFSQIKTTREMGKTESWAKKVQDHLLETNGKWYQAYMPFATREEFEKCYGEETVNKMRSLKQKYDPTNVFSNGHTAKYYDKNLIGG